MVSDRSSWAESLTDFRKHTICVFVLIRHDAIEILGWVSIVQQLFVRASKFLRSYRHLTKIGKHGLSHVTKSTLVKSIQIYFKSSQIESKTILTNASLRKN